MAEIIFALDFDDLREARDWVKKLKDELQVFKIGFQLFTRSGPKAVEMVKKLGKDVFLDLKVFDIPRTCSKAVESAAKLGCYSLTIHTLAGEEALREAKKGQKKGYPHLWGVTVLSSIAEGASLKRAERAYECGLEGVIVSGKDVKRVKDKFPHMEIVVPGVRPQSYNKEDDQKRVLTPLDAVKRGADFLVMGRPIRNANDPLKLVRTIKEEIR